MRNPDTQPPLFAILGPTGSGKSALAIHLARQLGGEVISCDSTQLYRGFDIGTGKPTREDRQGIPHHLLDVLDANQESTAGAYREMAIAVLNDLRERKKLPILTVGTGLYMRALFEGLAELPQRSEELRTRLRSSAEKHGQPHLHRLLKRLDPQSANRIAPADTQKLLRAVEVCLLTRRPLTEVHDQGRSPLTGWQIIKIGLHPEREQLYERIHSRIDKMLAQGWQAEITRLLTARSIAHSGNSSGAGRSIASFSSSAGIADPRETAKPFDFLGYRELAAVARNELSLEEARQAIRKVTRHYAKRQQTWFRREQNVKWFEGFGDDLQLQSEVGHWLKRFSGVSLDSCR
jgi:tRNA dimethylallyltransferase